MSKINLVRVGWTDLNSIYLEKVLGDQFNLTSYDTNSSYGQDDLLVITRPEYYKLDTIRKFLADGHKVIIANLWEARPFVLAGDFEPYLDRVLVILGCKNSFDYGWKHVINVPNWFWYNESLWYTFDTKFQFQNYKPNRVNSKLFFMPIKRSKPFRDAIVNRLADLLDQAEWSYVERWCDGKKLETKKDNPMARVGWDRQFEAEWYDHTYFSIAVETCYGQTDVADELVGIRSDERCPAELFITEKTYKPIAFQHPFMVLGMQGTLNHLGSLGFETYDHLFDESYDSIDQFDDRLEIVYKNAKEFVREKYLDPLTQEKIKHNYELFYDQRKVLDGIHKEFTTPVLEWINAK